MYEPTFPSKHNLRRLTLFCETKQPKRPKRSLSLAPSLSPVTASHGREADTNENGVTLPPTSSLGNVLVPSATFCPPRQVTVIPSRRDTFRPSRTHYDVETSRKMKEIPSTTETKYEFSLICSYKCRSTRTT